MIKKKKIITTYKLFLESISDRLEASRKITSLSKVFTDPYSAPQIDFNSKNPNRDRFYNFSYGEEFIWNYLNGKIISPNMLDNFLEYCCRYKNDNRISKFAEFIFRFHPEVKEYEYTPIMGEFISKFPFFFSGYLPRNR